MIINKNRKITEEIINNASRGEINNELKACAWNCMNNDPSTPLNVLKSGPGTIK